ncbi:protein kinase [bacterium]|nr:protein kinase [bacterium]
MSDYNIIKILRKREATTTFLAEKITGEKVIIKKFHISESKDWKSVELFKREAETLKSLRHSEIPQYLEFFKDDEDGTFSIVQEFIDGVSLQEKLDEGAIFKTDEIEIFLKKIVQILSYLQSFTPQIIHRDIKPSNIILKNGDLKNPSLIDFGSIQRAVSNDFTIVGTTGFSAPEQATGRAFPQSDFYALGTTLLYILTKKEPIDIPFENMCFKYKNIVNPPQNLSNFIDKTTSFNPSERPQTTDELLEILNSINKIDSINTIFSVKLDNTKQKNNTSQNNQLKVVIISALFFMFLSGFILFFVTAKAPLESKISPIARPQLISSEKPSIQKSNSIGIESCIQKECRTYNLSCDENSLLNMTTFSCNDQSITTLNGVEKLKNLKNLYIYNNNILDLSPVSKLENLEKISMGKNKVASLEPLKNLKKLTHITAYDNSITDLNPLKNLTQLEELVIWKNPFKDLAPLSSLKNLKILEISHNKSIESISVLKSLEKLRIFKASYCSLGSLNGLENSKNLETLDVASNNIMELLPLSGFRFLKSVSINDNKISDLSPISESENISYIQISNNQISDLSPLKKMTKMDTIWAYNNQIEDISILKNMIYLKSVSLWKNRIKNISPLKEIGNLNKLDLSGNCVNDFSELKHLESILKKDKQNSCN